MCSAGAPGSIFNAYQRLPERERRQNGRPPPGGGGGGGGGGGTAGAPGALSSNNGAHACPVLGSVAFASVAVSSAGKIMLCEKARPTRPIHFSNTVPCLCSVPLFVCSFFLEVGDKTLKFCHFEVFLFSDFFSFPTENT